jgi:hypothetical protein
MSIEIHTKPKEIVRLTIADASRKLKSCNIRFVSDSPSDVINRVKEVIEQSGRKEMPAVFHPLTGPEIPRVYVSARHYPNKPGSETITVHGFTPQELGDLLSAAV